MTIRDIAKLAGTSRGTVDRVLNGRGNVRKELADKIREIAEENGYTPNSLAQALVKSRDRFTIGVVINSLGNPFFTDVLHGIQRKAAFYESYGLNVSIKEIRGYDAKEQLDAIREATGHGVDALAITPLEYPEIAAELNALTIPVVMFNTEIESANKLAFVGCDYVNSGQLTGDLAKLLLNEGGAVAIVIGSQHVYGHRQRVEGIQSVLKSAHDVEIVAVAENNDSDERSYEVTRRLIREQRPDLFCFAAAGIEGGMRAIEDERARNYVLAVDETEFTKKCLRNGTIAATVTQQPEEQGDLTMDILYNYLANGKPPRKVRNYTQNQVRLRHSYT